MFSPADGKAECEPIARETGAFGIAKAPPLPASVEPVLGLKEGISGVGTLVFGEVDNDGGPGVPFCGGLTRDPFEFVSKSAWSSAS